MIGQEKSLIPQSTEVKDKRKGTELILVKLRSINTGWNKMLSSQKGKKYTIYNFNSLFKQILHNTSV